MGEAKSIDATIKKSSTLLSIYVNELAQYVRADGSIQVHNNSLYPLSISNKVDLPRQAFAFYALAKAQFHCSKDLLDSEVNPHLIAEKLFLNYTSISTLTDLERKYIEIYASLGLRYLKHEKLSQNFRLSDNLQPVFSDVLLMSLYLQYATDKTVEVSHAHKFAKYVDPMLELIRYSIFSDHSKTVPTFAYIGLYRPLKILAPEIFLHFIPFIEAMLIKNYTDLHFANSSALASILEGCATFNDKEHTFVTDLRLRLKFELSTRGITLSPYLQSKYSYSKNSIPEIPNSAYLCTDTYAHIILSILASYDNES